MSQVGNIGQRLDLLIKQGADFGKTVLMTDANGVAYPLTGITMAGQIRQKALDTTKIADFTLVVDPTGSFTFSLTAAQTALIVCGESMSDAASQYVYDIQMTTTATGKVRALLYGAVKVFREVTR